MKIKRIICIAVDNRCMCDNLHACSCLPYWVHTITYLIAIIVCSTHHSLAFLYLMAQSHQSRLQPP